MLLTPLRSILGTSAGAVLAAPNLCPGSRFFFATGPRPRSHYGRHGATSAGGGAVGAGQRGGRGPRTPARPQAPLRPGAPTGAPPFLV
ncbi:unnamed protein product [Pipistrellus nathusii]|uniref:Secreted protein n=1 Tax=Pipistrellus nathusii TaxID=59473 RepID=A0ABP0AKZ5_PIPNA